MPKYLETKTGSLESAVQEAVSKAQQAAIAIAKKEKGEEPKKEIKEITGKEVANRMRKIYVMKPFADKVAKMKTVTRDDLEKILPDYVDGKYLKQVLSEEEIDEAKLPRQLMNPKKEMMVVKMVGKSHKVVVIDKSEWDKYKKDGWMQAEELDPVNQTAVKKKFDDRKDKDIDNDGDVDSTDKYLHKRRKAISKEVQKESNLIERAVNYITAMWSEAAPTKVTQTEHDKEEEPKNGKTMTGKPMSKVEVNPKDKE